MQTLSIDVGGSYIKAAVLSADGQPVDEEWRVPTPNAITPDLLLDTIESLAKRSPPFDRVSIGFPGVVRDGVVLTAPNLGNEQFAGFHLERDVAVRLGKPVRACNDADMQGYGAIAGRGVEMVITLGTGFGSSIFMNGRLGPHLELAHHCFRGGRTYEEELGEPALRMVGADEWNTRLAAAIEVLRSLTHFDHLYVGGGNSRLVTLALPTDVSIVSNVAGVLGGVKLWEY